LITVCIEAGLVILVNSAKVLSTVITGGGFEELVHWAACVADKLSGQIQTWSGSWFLRCFDLFVVVSLWVFALIEL